MIQITIYKPDGNKLYQNVTNVTTEDGVLKFDFRNNPTNQYSYSTIRTTCPYFIEETFGQ